MSGRFALDTRIAALALAFVLAVVTMPMIAGVVITDAHCAFTMDICHPAQAADVCHAPLLAPAPQLLSLMRWSAPIARVIADGYIGQPDRMGEAPDPPPPKHLA